ncbi:hypothetical protein PG993_010628 [Apiospora rasikravindrae]|uniref:C2H2-type domain-containing protein n=1 Tax=Apiospora rasikravindrae TaxID=990691 RepID=A0ABR1SMS3_9PEZI
MDRGLDDLVEWLLTEIGFSGLQGFSPLHLVKAVKTFYTQTNAGTETAGADAQLPLPSFEVVNSQEVGESDVVQASVVWNWLTARNDVIVGDDNRYKGISLKEALDISGYVPFGNPNQTLPTEAAQGSTANNESAGTDSRRSGKAVSKITPRLHLSEERLWKAITGHQPDLKKVPQFEWQALVAIASVREVGILQGDLVRLTNQDKRSLPTRTDALARKGYIVKQPVMLRGCRTSKIWLAQFADHAKQETINEGLASAKVDLSRETLTKDWEPVPFSHFWNGARVDHIALAQGFLAIVKAFGKIRYCDIRIKLDIVGKTSQMRAMGKSSRWFAHRGIVEFRPMKAPDSNRVFKDCVEFIRDPTAEEWQAFRKTPTTRMRLKDPPSHRKDKSAASLHDSAKTGSKLSRSAQNELKTQQALIAKLPSPAMIRLSAWNPYKPLINTVFDIIKRSGTEGTSNLNIGYFLLGWPYRKWIFSMTTLLGQQRVHPEHLKPFSVTAQLARRGKTMTYSFFATSNIKSENGNTKLPQDGEQQETAENATTSDAPPPTDLNIKYGFSRPNAKVFLRNSSAKYVSMPKRQELILPIEPSEPNTPDKLTLRRTRQTKRSQPGHEDENSASEQLSETPTKRKRLVRGRKSSTPSLVGQVEETHPEPMDIDDPQPAESASAVPPPSQVAPESMPPPPLPSGVFYGRPNSLDPRKTKGRKRKSLVLVFRHPSLRKPSETGRQSAVQNKPLDTSSEQHQPVPNRDADESKAVAESTSIGAEHPTTPVPESAPKTVLPVHQEDVSTRAADQEGLSTPAEGAAPRNKGSKRGDKRFTCETCGNSWKNTNGLEYHKKKSQSTCNPTWVPPPPSLEILSVRRTKAKELPLPKKLATPSKSPKTDQERSQLALPTKRPNRARPDTPQETSPIKGSQPRQSTVLLSVGQIHSGPGLLAAGRRVPPGANENFKGTEQLSHVHTSASQPSMTTASPLVPKTDVGTVLQGSNATPLASTGATSTPTPVLALPDRATPDHPLPTPKHSVTPQAQALQETTSNIPASAAQRDTKQRSSKATIAQRRIRTTSLIEELLRENGGAFPGDHALHVVISSIWPRRFNDDVDPPDQRTCDIIVKKMIGAKVIRQDHYGFKDYQGKVKSISVISKASDVQGEEALSEKILGIKAKSIELYPDPYIPPGLSMLGGPNQAEALGIGETGSIPTAFTSIAKGSIRKSVLTLDYHMPVEAPTLPRAVASASDSTKRTHQESAGVGQESSWPPKRQKLEGDQDGFNHVLGSSPRPDSYPMATNVDAGQPGDHQADSMEIDAINDTPGRGRGRGRGRGVGRGRGRGRGRGTTTGRGRGAGQGPGRGRGRGGKRVNVALDDDSFARQADAARCTWATESDLSVLWNLDADLPNVQRAIQLSESTRVLYPQPSDFTGMQQDDSDDDDEDRFLAEIPPQDDDVSSDESDTAEVRVHASANIPVRFAPVRRIEALGDGIWPAELPKGPRPGGVGESFAMIGNFPTQQWFLRENLPQNAEEMISMAPDASRRPSRAQNLKGSSYEAFVQNAMGIEAWELSSEGVYLQFSGTAAPDYKFISLGVGEKHTSTPMTSKLEWQSDLQYTAANLPQDILEAPSDDDICVPQRVGSLAAGEPMNQPAPPPAPEQGTAENPLARNENIHADEGR